MNEIDASALRTASPFGSKLTDQHKREILALIKKGVRYSVIATAYDVSLRTLSDIGNPEARTYKSTRKEYYDLGPEKFEALYLTEEAVDRVNKAMEKPVPVTRKAVADSQAKKRTEPNRHANRMEGVHVIGADKVNGYNRSYVIKIEYRDSWGYLVTNLNDEALRTEFVGADGKEGKPFLTSSDAYEDAAGGSIMNLEF